MKYILILQKSSCVEWKMCYSIDGIVEDNSFFLCTCQWLQADDGHHGKPAGGMPGVPQPVPPGLPQAPGDGQGGQRPAPHLALRPLHQADETPGKPFIKNND